jgi:hypothetical protein
MESATGLIYPESLKKYAGTVKQNIDKHYYSYTYQSKDAALTIKKKFPYHDDASCQMAYKQVLQFKVDYSIQNHLVYNAYTIVSGEDGGSEYARVTLNVPEKYLLVDIKDIPLIERFDWRIQNNSKYATCYMNDVDYQRFHAYVLSIKDASDNPEIKYIYENMLEILMGTGTGTEKETGKAKAGDDDFQRALQPPRLSEPGSAPLGAKKVDDSLLLSGDLRSPKRVEEILPDPVTGKKRHYIPFHLMKYGLDHIDHLNKNPLDNRDVNMGHLSKSQHSWKSQVGDAKMRINNSSGKTGVFYGCCGNYDYWEVRGKDFFGNKIYKKFSIKKYGYEGSRHMAIHFRDMIIDKSYKPHQIDEIYKKVIYDMEKFNQNVETLLAQGEGEGGEGVNEGEGTGETADDVTVISRVDTVISKMVSRCDEAEEDENFVFT